MNSKCIDCGKELSTDHYKRCRNHHLLYLVEFNKKREYKPLSEETKRKIGLKSLGRKKTPETIEKLRQKLLGRKFTTEHREKISQTRIRRIKEGKIIPPTLGKHLSIETKEKIRKARLGKPNSSSTKFKKGHIPWSAGKKNYLSKETLAILSKKRKELWQNKEYAEKTIRAQLKGLLVRPTSFEQQIIDLCKKNSLPYKYVGDGEVIIGYKNPDFICATDEKKIIETYFTKWHILDYEKQRTNHFLKYGYKVLFLNENDLICDNWEEICLKKIQDFK